MAVSYDEADIPLFRSKIKEIHSTQLISSCINAKDASKILNIISIDSKDINNKYNSPTDTIFRNTSWYPIINDGRKLFYAQPKPILCRSICERVYTLTREAQVPDLDNKMGRALEIVTNKVLNHFGITPSVLNQKYKSKFGHEHLETDIIIETESRIYFIECTKKPLTAVARSGNVIASMKDLEGSFLKLVQQLSRHEAEIRESGVLHFLNGQTIELAGRSVEKIGINLFDHGSLQSRDFTMALIERLVGSSLNSNAAEAQETIGNINKRLERLHQNTSRILKIK